MVALSYININSINVQELLEFCFAMLESWIREEEKKEVSNVLY